MRYIAILCATALIVCAVYVGNNAVWAAECGDMKLSIACLWVMSLGVSQRALNTEEQVHG